MVVVVKEGVHHRDTERAQRATEFFSVNLGVVSVPLW
jgi:hypothetical protein